MFELDEFTGAARVFGKVYYFEGEPFLISSNERKRLPMEDTKEFVYGEIEFVPFLSILLETSPKKGEVFYDLGSGAGKAVIASALCFSWKKACGVEIFQGLHECSCKIREKLKNGYAEDVKAPIEFVCSNFFDYDFTDGDVVFASTLCFKKETLQALTDKCLELKKGSRVISLGKELHADGLEMISEDSYCMSWGPCEAYIYLRK